jgi:hypothetical protein
MRTLIIFLVIGVAILIVISKTKRPATSIQSDAENNPNPPADGYSLTNHYARNRYSNQTDSFNDSILSNREFSTALKDVVRDAHQAADQLIDLFDEVGFTKRELSIHFVDTYNALTRIRQFEDMISKDWTERTAEIVQNDQNPDLSEARRRQEYHSLAASLSAVNQEMRREQMLVRNRLIERLGTPKSMDVDTFHARLFSIYPRGPLPESVVKGIDSTINQSKN